MHVCKVTDAPQVRDAGQARAQQVTDEVEAFGMCDLLALGADHLHLCVTDVQTSARGSGAMLNSVRGGRRTEADAVVEGGILVRSFGRGFLVSVDGVIKTTCEPTTWHNCDGSTAKPRSRRTTRSRRLRLRPRRPAVPRAPSPAASQLRKVQK